MINEEIVSKSVEVGFRISNLTLDLILKGLEVITEKLKEKPNEKTADIPATRGGADPELKHGKSELDNLRVAVHEVTHSKLHVKDENAPKDTPRPDRRTREVQAESIAYVVCQHYGLDTSDSSFGYIAEWSGGKQLDALKNSLDTIRKEADAIITEIDKHFTALTQNKEQTAERQPGFETWSEPATPENAPDNPGVPSDDVNKYLPQEQAEPEPQGGTFTIYQLRDGDETRSLRNETLAAVTAAGLTVALVNYDKVYSAPLDKDMTLDDIHFNFNMEHPEDFKGHSLSVSDVVVMNRDGKETAFYVDGVGFQELPDFLTPKEQAAELKGNVLWQEYTALTERYPDDIVFKRIGDFYEVMGDKANIVANELGLVVAGRDVGLTERVPLTGIPVHHFDALVKGLVDKDFKITVAENDTIKQFSKPAQTVDLKIVADYMQKQYDYANAASPDSQTAVATVSIITRRLEQANARIPDNQPQLKALLTHAAQSPDLATLKERMNTMHSEFIQHYSTAVQMTLDTSGKAEPKTPPAATVRQNEPTPAPKAPAYGENVAAIEAKVKAGEVINLSDLSEAMKKDKAAQTTPAPSTGRATPQTPAKPGQTRTYQQGKTAAPEQPSIKDKIAAGRQEIAAKKSAPSKAPAQNKNAAIGG